MAQTTGAYDSSAAVVKFSTDGSSFTDVSGSTVSFTPGAQNRAVGKQNTVDGDQPIVRQGKLDVMQGTFVGVYTHTTGELFPLLKAAWENKSSIYVKYQYGNTTADEIFTTGKGFLNSFTWPKVDATDPNPIPFQCVGTFPGISAANVSTGSST